MKAMQTLTDYTPQGATCETECGDMTIEELYSLIEEEVKAIYEKDDAV